MLIEKLFRLIAYYLCLSTHQRTFGFKTLDGRFNKSYIKDETNMIDLKNCFNRYCQGETNCIVNYNNLRLTCRHVAFFSAQVLEWAADKHLIHDKNWKIAYGLTNPFHKVPIIVWLLDQTARGKNYGSIPALTTSSSKLDYGANYKGPRPGVPFIYPQTHYHSTTYVRPGGAKEPLLFNLKKPFTMALWIIQSKYPHMTYISTFPWGIFWQGNRPSRGQMSLCIVNACAVTEKNLTKIYEWRHVALVMNPKAPKMYIDGYENKLVKNDIKPEPPFQNEEPYNLVMWADVWRKDKFMGAMACVTIFQPFLLSDSEIRHLRQICP